MLPLLLCFCLILVLPGEALAWGIGVHLRLGSQMLNSLHLLPKEVALLLAAYPYDYLYGCISADITLGKKYTHYLQHCHSWRMGGKIFEAARGGPQKACAYGYLAHLAADSVAHGYMIPYKMLWSFNTRLLKHAYWEMRFEALVEERHWRLARELARRNFDEHDRLMSSLLAETLFSFSTNKKLFNSLLLLNRLKAWQEGLRRLGGISRWRLGEEHQSEYFELGFRLATGILSELDRSPYWRTDPTGEKAIEASKMIRKNMKTLWDEGKLSGREVQQILKELKPRFREGLTQPERILELLSVEPPS